METEKSVSFGFQSYKISKIIKYLFALSLLQDGNEVDFI